MSDYKQSLKLSKGYHTYRKTVGTQSSASTAYSQSRKSLDEAICQQDVALSHAET